MAALCVTLYMENEAILLVFESGEAIALSLLALLSVSFLYSFLKMKRVANQATLGFSKPLLILNLVLLTLLIASEAWFILSEYVERMSVINSNLATEITRLCVKIILLRLAQSFGLSVTVRSFVNASQDLVIVGVDRTGVEQFKFVVKATTTSSTQEEVSEEMETQYNDVDVSYIEQAPAQLRYLTEEHRSTFLIASKLLLNSSVRKSHINN